MLYQLSYARVPASVAALHRTLDRRVTPSFGLWRSLVPWDPVGSNGMRPRNLPGV
jgi:hypothetical protein